MRDFYKRNANIAKSLGIDLNDPDAKLGRIALAKIGSIDPNNDMMVYCTCGDEYKIIDCRMEDYDNGQWHKRAGRKGYHWHCPNCGEIVWEYYSIIS